MRLALIVDQEIRGLIEEGHERATQIIKEKQSNLYTLAEMLQEKEVISGEEVAKVMENESTSPP
jgi:cell division protease FtsH